ncbi:hypothetical protein PIB30_060480 [Stylosanthes scabra]|uniref:RNase H type-1 domain-containing protein n=1 Tax=Stylosanthes scabra TaxID=79078 RepID=A0ABU6TMR4_9FABA|nr:hypothetical protein [Stylosanthes scabra]
MQKRAKLNPPPKEWLECNVDASFTASSNKSSSAVVLRDWKGILLTSASSTHVVFSALAAEASAMIMARNFQLERVLFESDYSKLIQAIKSALDVSFLMALEQSHLDLYNSSYDQNSDRRSGLTALGEFCALIFGCEFVIESLRTGRSLNIKVIEIEFLFPKSPSFLQSDNYSSVSPLRILPSL